MIRLESDVYRSIENVLLIERQYDPRFNVVGFGIGKKSHNGVLTDEDALCVYVEEKLDISAFPRGGSARPLNVVVPVNRPVGPDEVFDTSFTKQDEREPGPGQLRVSVIETKSKVVLQTVAPRGQLPRVVGGVSIGLPNETDGTAGCIVRNNPSSNNRHGLNRDFYLLTAGHVLNKYGRAMTHDVCHPGPTDLQARGLGAAQCVFARTLATTPPISFSAKPPFPVFHVDAGIAAFTGTMVVDQFEQRVIYCGGIKETGKANAGTIVKKVGRTTGLTFGEITVERGSFTIFESVSSSARAILSDQIITTSMSREGDSGALLLDEANRAIGLLCGGSEDTSVFTPINTVLQELGIELF